MLPFKYDKSVFEGVRYTCDYALCEDTARRARGMSYKQLPYIPPFNVLAKCNLFGVHRMLMAQSAHKIPEIGMFRTRNTYNHGVSEWRPLLPDKLAFTFDTESAEIESIENILERSFVIMSWLLYREFFLDGNRRVAWATCDSILRGFGVGTLCARSGSVADSVRARFTLLRTADASSLMQHLLVQNLVYFPQQGKVHWPE